MNICGDGKPDTTGHNAEQCDLGTGNGQTAACSKQCTTAACGDGIIETGEQCDNGTANADNADCTVACKVNVCGDGKKDTAGQHTEQCDDGALNGNGTDACSGVCTTIHCGNGVTEVGEQCDAGANNSNSGDCLPTCKLNKCGDGKQDTTGTNVEACDDNNQSNTDDCLATCVVATCGDGFTDGKTGPKFEECDDGAANGTETCPYNTSCFVCSATCTTVAGPTSKCGDGTIDAGQEFCDDFASNGCGACSASCGEATSTAATGLLVVVGGGDLTDGETFTLDDGFNAPVIFEYDNNAAIGTDHVAVAFTAGQSAHAVALATAAAIGLAPSLNITGVANAGAAITLTNARKSSAGNVAIALSSSNLSAVGMSGGQGGSCVATTTCKVNDDCLSGVCSGTPKKCQ